MSPSDSTAESRPGSPARYKCPLCGCEFDASDQRCHSCPMARTCSVICCPNCGYGFATQSRLVGWLKRIFRKKEAPR